VQKILIIEDDPSGAHLLATLLRMEGYQAFQAGHWTNLVQDVEEQQPDLVIMDVRLQAQSGFDVLEQIRTHADPAVARTPVLMISAEDQRTRSRLAGANGFIEKPYSFLALVDAIRHAEEGEKEIEILG
jgi:two-component system sensor histidine kinase ChiS